MFQADERGKNKWNGLEQQHTCESGKLGSQVCLCQKPSDPIGLPQTGCIPLLYDLPYCNIDHTTLQRLPCQTVRNLGTGAASFILTFPVPSVGLNIYLLTA